MNEDTLEALEHIQWLCRSVPSNKTGYPESEHLSTLREVKLVADKLLEVQSIKSKEEARPFPVLGTSPKRYISWGTPNEEWASYNHGQTLERLAERGGLDRVELYANVMGMSCEEAIAYNRTGGCGEIYKLTQDNLLITREG